MTTIVAIEHADGVTFAYDSQVTSGGGGFTRHDDQQKVFQNGELVFGIAGSVLDAQIIEHMDIPSIKKRHAGNLDAWVTNRLIPSIRENLAAHGALEVDKQQTFADVHALACVRGRIYRIGSNTAWTRREDGVYAVGSGSHFAMGALGMGASARKAVKVARANDLYTGGPIRTIEVRYERTEK